MIRPFLCFFALLPLTCQAADPSPPVPPVREPDKIIHPWREGSRDGQLPDGWKTDGPESSEVTRHMGGTLSVKNVSDPVLAWFAPDKKTATPAKGIIICPGGGYNILAWDLEGTEIAARLSKAGYHAWVLKYRLPRPGTSDVRHLAALQDAQRSLSLVRSQAAATGVDPAQIGIMGFSAGGHLAAIASTSGNDRAYPALDAIDAVPCRPDFTVLIYPAYLMQAGDQPGLSPPPGSPPAFISQSADDPLPCRNSLGYFAALTDLRVPAELHLWPDGGHGYGMRSPLSPAPWPDLLIKWLAAP